MWGRGPAGAAWVAVQSQALADSVSRNFLELGVLCDYLMEAEFPRSSPEKCMQNFGRVHKTHKPSRTSLRLVQFHGCRSHRCNVKGAPAGVPRSSLFDSPPKGPQALSGSLVKIPEQCLSALVTVSRVRMMEPGRGYLCFHCPHPASALCRGYPPSFPTF